MKYIDKLDIKDGTPINFNLMGEIINELVDRVNELEEERIQKLREED